VPQLGLSRICAAPETFGNQGLSRAGAGRLDKHEKLVIGWEAFVVHPIHELPQMVRRRGQFGEYRVELGYGQIPAAHRRSVRMDRQIGSAPKWLRPNIAHAKLLE